MTTKYIALAQIITALIFATLIMIISALFKNSEYIDSITNSLLAIYFIPFAYFAGVAKKHQKATGCKRF